MTPRRFSSDGIDEVGLGSAGTLRREYFGRRDLVAERGLLCSTSRSVPLVQSREGVNIAELVVLAAESDVVTLSTAIVIHDQFGTSSGAKGRPGARPEFAIGPSSYFPFFKSSYFSKKELSAYTKSSPTGSLS